MKTLHSEQDRAELLQRIGKLTPKHSAVWGKMTVSQMVVHLADSMRMTTGELSLKLRKTPLRFAPIKKLIIHALPFPKGAPTAPELQSRTPSNWRADIVDLQEQVKTFGKHASRTEWPVHPAFGPLSAKDWGVLAYRHMDHHLRQFGE